MILKALVIDDFEHNNLKKYDVNYNYVDSYKLMFNERTVRNEKRSLELSFDLGGWVTGNGAMPIIFKEKKEITKMPVKLAMWVYAEGKVPWLRAVIRDGAKEVKTVNLTEASMSWVGWKYIEGEIDSSWELPLQLEQIYAVEIDKAYQQDASYRGKIIFSDVRAVYIDDEDWIGPQFEQVFPENTVVYEESFEFSVIVRDDMSGVDPSSIKVYFNQILVDHHYDENTQQVSYFFEKLPEGTYQIKVTAYDHAGNLSVPYLEKEIQIDLSPDSHPPVLSCVTPSAKALEYSATPRITFHLMDEKSGVSEADICVEVNRLKQKVVYDPKTGWGYAVVLKPLLPGEHSLVITAKDQAGNASPPFKQSFKVTRLKPPSRPDKFTVSIIPDTHSVSYNKLAFKTVMDEDSNFVIQMGDMVDQASEAEYRMLKQQLCALGGKPLVSTPGNHESFQGNLDHYRNVFGSPTYHFIYGNSLFIFLNTAFHQSISLSDSTQFTYLEECLSENKQTNVIIVTHVPTKDAFGTSHQMAEADANRLETILENYKASHPFTSLTVLFGHLHVINQWEKNGINYIITGNSARKGYVQHENGNILGHGLLNIDQNNVTYNYLPHVKKVKVFHLDKEVEEISLTRGESSNLRIITEVDELSSQYEVDVTDFESITKTWTISNKRIIGFQAPGTIFALKEGSVFVQVEVGGITTKIKVLVRP